jgi:hypothetical protein
MAAMQVEAFLADSVQAAEGKLYALGLGWSTISAPRFPTRHDRVGIGVVVRFGEGESGGPHTLELRFVGPDGAARTVGRGPDGGALEALRIPFVVASDGGGAATFALNLNGVPFDAEGEHAFAISIDGAEAKVLPFRVQTPPAPPPAEYRHGVYL